MPSNAYILAEDKASKLLLEDRSGALLLERVAAADVPAPASRAWSASSAFGSYGTHQGGFGW